MCQVAHEHDLIIIADEIYRDLVHDPAAAVPSPVAYAPERTVVTTALSKNLALGGWRIGVARLPDGAPGGHCGTGCSASAARSGPHPRCPSSTPPPSRSANRPN